MSTFQETLGSAVQKEQTLSFYQNTLIALASSAIGVLLLVRPIPVPFHIDIGSFVFAMGVLLFLWDEPVWNEPLGKWCSRLALFQKTWPIFIVALVTMNGWVAKDGTAFTSFLLSAVICLVMRGKAEHNPCWIFFSVGALLLLQRTGSLAAALMILIPFFWLVLAETIARTKGRLDSARKVWIPFSILLGGFVQIIALTTALR